MESMVVADVPSRFTDDDIRKIVDTQSQISANLAVASTNLAVASNNIDWIVKTYSTEYKKMTDMQLEISNLKTTFWKYIGIGTGIAVSVSFITTLITLYIKLSSLGVS
jgi:hypothetical protein